MSGTETTTTPRPLPISAPLPQGFGGLISGLSAFTVGLKLVMPGGRLFRYALVPAILSVLILTGLAVGAWIVVQGYLADWMEAQDWPGWLAWVGGVLAFLAAVMLAWFLYVPLLAIFGPLFFDPICEQVHLRYTGQALIGSRSAASFASRQLFAILQALKWTAVTLIIGLPVLIIGLVTGVGSLVALPVGALIQGTDLMDYPLALRHMKLRRKLSLAWKYRGAVLGLGGGAALCVLVPGLNLIAVPAGAAGATIVAIAMERSGEDLGPKAGSASAPLAVSQSSGSEGA